MPLDNYINNSDILISAGELRAQYYEDNDLSLLNPINGYMQDPPFGTSDFDRIEMHIYDLNSQLLKSNHKVEGWSLSTDTDGAPQIDLNINKDLRDLGLERGVFSAVYNFHRDAAGAPMGPKFKISKISKSRKEVRLVATDLFDEDVNDELLETFYSRFQKLKVTSNVQAPYNVAAIPNNPLWTNITANFGFNRNYQVVSWVIDDIFPLQGDQPETILLKLLNPLPLNITTDQIGWLSAEAARPSINRIQLDSGIEILGTNIAGPNFDLCLDETARLQTGYKNYNELLGSDSDVKSDLINNYSGSLDGVRLNIDYSVIENFVHFSSAEARVNNFIYKLRKIRGFDTQARKYDYSEYPASDIYIYEYTGSHGSKYVKKYQKKWVDKKVKLINEFDDFEKWLYFESGSKSKYIISSGSRGGGTLDWSRSALQPFPKLSGSYKNDLWTEDYLEWNLDQIFDWAVHSVFIPGPNYELLNLTSSKVSNWQTETLSSASQFDKWNPNLLQKTVPQYLSDTGKSSNETYLRFLDLVGQSHDVSWTYTKYFTQLNSRLQNSNFENRVGLSDDIVYHIGKSYGINLLDGDPNQDLWYYRLGQGDNGHVIQNNPTSSIKTLTSKQRTAEVWKRLVNNLPFLLKAKGTEAGIRGILNCYGIPEHILPINEYGSSKKSEQVTRYKEHQFRYCLNFNSQSIATNWGPHAQMVDAAKSVRFNVGGSDIVEAVTPDAVEFRAWPNTLPQSINNRDASFSQSLWQVNNDMGIVLHRSHSSTRRRDGSGRIQGLTDFGHFELVMSQSRASSTAATVGDGYVKVQTGKAKIFESTNKKEDNTGWWTILLNRKASTNYHSSSLFEYELTAMRAGYGDIDQTVSASLFVTASSKDSDAGFYSSSINNAWSGSLNNSTRAYLGGFVTSSNPDSYRESMNTAFGDPFNGSLQELRYYANPINQKTLKNHTLAPEMYSTNTGTETFTELLLQLKLDTKINHWSGSAGLNSTSASNIIESQHPNQITRTHWDTLKTFNVSGTAFNFPNKPTYGFTEGYSYIDTPELGPNNYTSNKVRVEENKLIRHLSSEARAEAPSSDKYALDSNKLGIYFSPTDQVNSDLFNHIGGQQLDNFIGNPREAYTDRYEELAIINNKYWNKYTRDTSKSVYLNELKQYDMSMFTLIKRYLPARANADLGVIIEPHFIERSKIRSRGKLSISGDTKAQNIALDAKSFTRAQAPTDISCGKPEVAQAGFALEPQTTTGAVAPKTAGGNSVLKLSSAPQQFVQTSPTHTPNTTAYQTVLVNDSNRPFILLSSQTAQSQGVGNQINQSNASSVVSHQVNSPLADIGGTITVGNQVLGTPYSFKSLFKSGSGAATKYIVVATPDYKVSASIKHVCDYTKSELRMVNTYHYYSASVEYKAGDVNHGSAKRAHAARSASFGKPYEDGGSVNRFAYSKSLKEAQVSDFNIDNRNYKGTQISAIDFNIAAADGSGEPVVSFTIGDPNQIISSDPSFGGNIKIE